MTTFAITEEVCRNIGPLEVKRYLQQAYKKVDKRIQALIKERGFPPAISSYILEARKTVSLLPIEGLAINLHDLYEATTIESPSLRNEAIQQAMEDLLVWKRLMEAQERAGKEMMLTRDFWVHCELLMNELDPDGSIRSDIEIVNKLFLELKQTALTTLILVGSYKIGSYLPSAVRTTVWTAYSLLTIQCWSSAVVNSLRSLKEKPAQSLVLAGICGGLLYVQTSAFLKGWAPSEAPTII